MLTPAESSGADDAAEGATSVQTEAPGADGKLKGVQVKGALGDLVADEGAGGVNRRRERRPDDWRRGNQHQPGASRCGNGWRRPS